QGVALTVAIVCWGAAVALSGLGRVLWVTVALLAVAGAADLVSAVLRQTILQVYAPDEMRGRLQGVFVVVVAGGPRLGDLRGGGTGAPGRPRGVRGSRSPGWRGVSPRSCWFCPRWPWPRRSAATTPRWPRSRTSHRNWRNRPSRPCPPSPPTTKPSAT